MENLGDSAFRISSTVRALSSALRGESRSAAGSEAPEVGVGSSSVRGGYPWFKESSAKNLRSGDFIAPSAVLNKLFPDGQVPEEAVQEVMSVQGGGCFLCRVVWRDWLGCRFRWTGLQYSGRL
ncbi:DALR anticodon-binding domain-containing protein 3 [Polyodon spathula]|uniref:DALR anticodon-binding domain-containing protein 3 n=1 Tax=Polyodon spathula TaxID=7913 RepID=UPI001B7E217F|nr:DALR anticodon-binding domain-containing protein 3 [Polyodon spathula]